MPRRPTVPSIDIAGSYILERIRTILGTLTTSEARVAQLILDHPFEFMEGSAAELATRSQTSGATVVRTCRRLGFSGLQDLRLTLARDLGFPTQRTAAPQARTGAVVLQDLFDDAARTLSGMVTRETLEGFTTAVEFLVAARRVAVVASGPTQIFAHDFAINLQIIGRQAEFSPDAIMQNLLASQLTRKDVCVAVSSSGVNALTIDAARTARDIGVPVIGVTGFQHSHLAEIASVTLVANTFDFSTKRLAAVNAAGLLLMLRSLVIAIAERGGSSDASAHAILDAKQTMSRYVYRRRTNGT